MRLLLKKFITRVESSIIVLLTGMAIIGTGLTERTYGQSPDTTAASSASLHQIGFPATSTLRFFTRDDEQVYDLNYRYRFIEGRHFRTGLSLRYNSAGSDQFTFNTRFGLDRTFRHSADGHWIFYAGADLSLELEKRSTAGRWYYAGGLIPFIGAMYRVNEHFSLSTEPGFLMQVRHLNESDDSFNTPDNATWIEMEFVRIGQILISVHF